LNQFFIGIATAKKRSFEDICYLTLRNMIQKGTKVKWKWGNGYGIGKVKETYTTSITKTIKDSEVTRNGEEGNKALYIQQKDGDYVLKSESEVERED
jgi:hypothetical protein